MSTQRYHRHILLDEIGTEGQERLKHARVLLVGVGGLGSPIALYLAAAGVGRLGLVDPDRVDVTNLQRQVLFNENDLGRFKVDAAKERLALLNPEVFVDQLNVKLTAANALDLVVNYDLVIDGTDQFSVRYLLNDACVLLGKPLVSGAIFKFEGQVSVFGFDNGPCYRCVYKHKPSVTQNCSELGVLGVLPGVIGSIQATEAIKVILGIGEPLVGELLTYDALNMDFRKIKIKKDPLCAVCGDHPTITTIEETTEAEEAPIIPEVIPAHLRERIKLNRSICMVDVRTTQEFEEANIANSMNIPLADLEHEFAKLDPTTETIVYCKSGIRGYQAVQFLKERGFQNVANLKGGIVAWLS